MNALLNRKVCSIILTSIVLTTCGSPKRLVRDTTELQLIKQNAIVDRNINLNNIYGLISNYTEFDSCRYHIANHLQYEFDYSNYEYSELQNILKTAPDSILNGIFSKVIEYREDDVIEKLSQMTVPEIGSYYQANEDERTFIRPILETTLLKDIENKDYRYIKLLHNSFNNTDLSLKLDSIYTSTRDLLYPEYEARINEYCKIERQSLNELNASLKNRCRAYLNEGLPKIVEETNNKINRDLFDKLFSKHKSDSYSIKEYVDLIVQENYNSSIIESMLVDNFNIFVKECLQNRLIILEQFVEDPSLCNYTMEPIDREAYVKPSIPFNHIDAIQAIKADINWWSVGLTAAGFIPGLGTAISLTADAVDILYGLYADREESKLIKQHMESFATDLFANYHQNCNFNINQFYSKIHADIEKSQNEFKKFFYENF